MEERLQKILARSGVASRRKAEELIAEGRVLVNGKAASIGMKADAGTDYIKVNGKLISKPEPKVYIVLNKPSGVLTTFEDEEERPTVKDFLKRVKLRVFPVGRLDYNTEGMLLFTNDGEFSHRLTHPSYKVQKTYIVKVKGAVEESKLVKLRKGIMLEDGMTAPAKIRRVTSARAGKNTWLEIIIHEGRNRQIRRMFERIRTPVIKLKRVGIGGVRLKDLPEREWRYLEAEEIEKLKYAVRMNKSERRM